MSTSAQHLPLLAVAGLLVVMLVSVSPVYAEI